MIPRAKTSQPEVLMNKKTGYIIMLNPISSKLESRGRKKQI